MPSPVLPRPPTTEPPPVFSLDGASGVQAASTTQGQQVAEVQVNPEASSANVVPAAIPASPLALAATASDSARASAPIGEAEPQPKAETASSRDSTKVPTPPSESPRSSSERGSGSTTLVVPGASASLGKFGSFLKREASPHGARKPSATIVGKPVEVLSRPSSPRPAPGEEPPRLSAEREKQARASKDLSTLLAFSDTCAALESFTNREHSPENIAFMKACANYSDLRAQGLLDHKELQHRFLKELMKTFVKLEAASQINISSGSVRALLLEWINLRAKPLARREYGMLEAYIDFALDEVHGLFRRDTLPRYLNVCAEKEEELEAQKQKEAQQRKASFSGRAADALNRSWEQAKSAVKSKPNPPKLHDNRWPPHLANSEQRALAMARLEEYQAIADQDKSDGGKTQTLLQQLAAELELEDLENPKVEGASSAATSASDGSTSAGAVAASSGMDNAALTGPGTSSPGTSFSTSSSNSSTGSSAVGEFDKAVQHQAVSKETLAANIQTFFALVQGGDRVDRLKEAAMQVGRDLQSSQDAAGKDFSKRFDDALKVWTDNEPPAPALISLVEEIQSAIELGA